MSLAATTIGRPAQRMASTAIAASGIIAAILFFALHLPWYIFLLPALIGVVDQRRVRRRPATGRR